MKSEKIFFLVLEDPRKNNSRFTPSKNLGSMLDKIWVHGH